MKTLNLFTAAALMAAFSPSLFAADAVNDPNYFKAAKTSVTVTEKVTDLTSEDVFPPMLAAGRVSRNPAAIVNGGVQAWNVINGGKPSSDISGAYASAIPGFSFNWSNYSGWKKKSVDYNYTVTNLMGIDVIKVDYTISFFYNGQDLSDDDKPVKGHYITNFTVRPTETSVKWGWKFNMDVKMSDPMNIGSSKDPVAFMQADLNYVTSTPFTSDGGVWSYTVDGLGRFSDQNSKSRELTKEIGAVTAPETPAVSWN